MLARMVRGRLWATSLLVVGLGLITVACGSEASTPASGVTSPMLTPPRVPTATITIAPMATATATDVAGCIAPTSNPSYHFENPPGPLPTTIPLPPGTLVNNPGLGISAGSVSYLLCTPTMTSAAITAYMESALPAAGWLRNSVAACNAHSYPWYKGKYGMAIAVDANPSMPHVWALQVCPHVGEN